MGSGLFVVGVLSSIVATAFLVRRYGDTRTHISIHIVVGFAWWLSFSIVTLMPFDISATFYMSCVKMSLCDNTDNTTMRAAHGCGPGQNLVLADPVEWCSGHRESPFNCGCEVPHSYVGQATLRAFWKMVYWSSQFLTWLLLPLVEGYMSAGDFTFWGKLKSTLKENLIVYGSLLVVAVIVFIYLSVHEDMGSGELKTTVMMAANMWGLFMVILLLGHGLVDVPRSLWGSSRRDLKIRKLQFRAAKLYEEIAEATDTGDEIEKEIKEVASQISAGEPLRKFVKVILAKSQLGSVDEEHALVSQDNADDMVTVKTLTKLHKRLIKSRRVLNRCECQWNDLMETIFELQDEIESAKSPSRLFKRALGPAPAYPAALWMWKCWFRPWIIRAFAVFSTVMSILLLWSEITFWRTKPVLSVYALMVLHEGNRLAYTNLEFVSFMTLAYLCICTYTPIFRIRLFNFYYLVPNQQTDSSSMLFSAMIISRLTAPLCLNFISMVHLDTHVVSNNTRLQEETTFTGIQGHMDLFNSMNAYYSIVVIIVGLAVLFKVGNRLAALCGIQAFLSADDEDTQELVREGKNLAQREFRKRERSGRLATRVLGNSPGASLRAVVSRGNIDSASSAGGLRNGGTGLRTLAPSATDDELVNDDFDSNLGGGSLADDMMFESSTKSQGRAKSKYTKWSKNKGSDDEVGLISGESPPDKSGYTKSNLSRPSGGDAGRRAGSSHNLFDNI